jgi:Domain of unknown function (DUF4389)
MPDHVVNISVAPALTGRNRLTVAFRAVLAIPHLLLVGTPLALGFTIAWRSASQPTAQWGATPGVLGAVAGVCALIAWFAIVFGGEYPAGLRSLALYYLRWRVRAAAYFALLRDEYPPFGDAEYPASLQFESPAGSRNRLSVAFRIILLIPQFIALWFVGVAWAITTLIAWVMIILTGEFPSSLYNFGVGALRWSTRVEAYFLLLHDEYPPFSLS